MKKKIYILFSLCIMCTVLFSCKEYLDAKPNKTLAIPDNLPSLQALMDDYPRINNKAPGTGESSTDDYYITDADYNALPSEDDARVYTWQNSYLFAGEPNDWQFAFTGVYYANTIFEQLAKIERNGLNANEWDNIKGQAHFTKGFFELQGAWLWCQAYQPATAATDLGLPIKESTDFNKRSVRSNLADTYRDILFHLKKSIPLLPTRQIHVMRPSRPAAYGMVARALLSMRDYKEARLYADSALALNSTLMNFNNLKAATAYPIIKFNEEVLLDGIFSLPAPLSNTKARIMPSLYALYSDDDLRKSIFFMDNNNGSFAFKGSYSGSSSLFSGISTNELYLIKSECEARAGNRIRAMQTLGLLLKNRYKTGKYIGFNPLNDDDAVKIILTERRKELLFRGLRWADIKRLNLEGANISMNRTVAGKTYTILPNDKRYALPIPEQIIMMTGMEQNPR